MADRDDRILSVLRDGAKSSSEVAAALRCSRQAAHRRLSRLIEAGQVRKQGAARATRYRLASVTWQGAFPLEGLEEDRVFELLAEQVPAVGGLSEQATATLAYAVTEMVNNAIDHSAGTEVRLEVQCVGTRLTLHVEDDGVGAFAHLARSRGLASELAALQQISMGKTTSAPDRHTGEGLFFTSKAVDVFRLESGKLAWIVDNEREDAAVAQCDTQRKGTLVTLEVDTARVRALGPIFEAFTEGFEFSKTRVVVKLFEHGVRFISRSEAKRMLLDLERFREVVLDFQGVRTVGQGFADEVFRVWAKAHRDVALIPIHMNDAVAFMVERVQR